ncbi:MAG: aminoacyl-tRNA hydrolase, partial [Deltaproteobacteria bacterium]|nr:aminoacyl-tRNA hydrolase [Deltaproteobacteria bacterium]
DLDLEPGKLRLRLNGSDGGHRGLRSIIETLGTQEFKRIRIGIGRPEDKRQVVSFVLGSSPEETAVLQEAVAESARIASVFLETGKFENWSSP